MSADPENARPQDVARPHKRTRGTPSPETEALLDRYRAAMRAELEALLAELWPVPPTSGQLAMDGTVAVLPRPKLDERRNLWDLAIKLGRELSTSAAETAWTGALPVTDNVARPRAMAPRLTKRERTALGAE